MTVSEILYLIGEFISMEIYEARNVEYPEGKLYPSKMVINMVNGKKFGLYIEELKKGKDEE